MAPGITKVSPVSGYSEAEGEFSIEMTGIPQQVKELLLSFFKDGEEKEIIIPVDKGRFSYSLKPIFGKGMYNVSISVPEAVISPEQQDRNAAALVQFWLRF